MARMLSTVTAAANVQSAVIGGDWLVLTWTGLPVSEKLPPEAANASQFHSTTNIKVRQDCIPEWNGVL
jgi:hypothetical protein